MGNCCHDTECECDCVRCSFSIERTYSNKICSMYPTQMKVRHNLAKCDRTHLLELNLELLQ